MKFCLNAKLPRILAIVLFFLVLSGCGVLKKKQEPEVDIDKIASNPLPPEEAKAMLGEVGENWLYGQGIGETALTLGGIYVFPPYGIYVLGNAILSVSGYEEIRVSDALPDGGREDWNSVYDSVTSAPGKLTAAVAGEEFRSKDLAKARLDKYLNSEESAKDEIETLPMQVSPNLRAQITN